MKNLTPNKFKMQERWDCNEGERKIENEVEMRDRVMKDEVRVFE